MKVDAACHIVASWQDELFCAFALARVAAAMRVPSSDVADAQRFRFHSSMFVVVT